MTAPTQPDLMPWLGEHYGCRVVELGEDGDMFAVAGPEQCIHVTDRRALAAVLHWLRVDCGWGRDDMEFGEVKIKRQWVTVVDDDEEPWQWADASKPGAWAVTMIETW